MTTTDAFANLGKTHPVGWQSGMEALLQGRAREAVDKLSAFVRDCPSSYEGQAFLGAALNDVHRFAEAEAPLREAIRLDASKAAPHYQLGIAVAALGRGDEAVSSWRRTLQIEPTHEPARAALTQMEAAPHAATPPLSSFPNASFSLPTPIPSPFSNGASNAFVALPAPDLQRPNRTRALLYGIGAAVIGAVLWTMIAVLTQHEFSLVAILLGAFVGYAVAEGADAWADTSLQTMTVALTCVSFLLGQSLIIALVLQRDLLARGVVVAPKVLLALAPLMIPRVLFSQPMSIFFLFLACVWGWRITGQAKAAR